MRIQDKITEINRYLKELRGIIPDTLDEYKSSIEKKAACERYVEKIVESVVDLAFLLIKKKKFPIPEDDLNAFDILVENKLLDIKLSDRLKNAKGMRNIISHQYGKIDDGIVFHSITEELEKDVEEFLKCVIKENKS